MIQRFSDQKKISLFDDKYDQSNTYNQQIQLYCAVYQIALVELCACQCIGCDDQFSPLSLKRPRAAGDVVGVEGNIRGYLPVILMARWVLIIGTSWRDHQANLKPPWGPTLETISKIQLKMEHGSLLQECFWHT